MPLKTKANILVVDDDQDIGLMLKMMMEYKGYTVTLINRADQAEKALTDTPTALIILDMLIANANGTDVCKNLKGQASFTHIPVLMISALPDARQTCIDAGANDFLSKPFEMDAIINKVYHLINMEQH